MGTELYLPWALETGSQPGLLEVVCKSSLKKKRLHGSRAVGESQPALSSVLGMEASASFAAFTLRHFFRNLQNLLNA